MSNSGRPKPPNAGRGRPKGALNKTTASVKQAILDAFEKRGGVASLVKWAKENETEFYKLWGRLAPTEVSAEMKHTGKLQVTVRIQREGRRITAS